MALIGYLLNPLTQTAHLPETFGREARQITSAIFGIVIALCIIGVEMRARRASLKTLVGAAIGSILGIVGAYLIGMLITLRKHDYANEEFLTVVLAFFFMAYSF